MKPAKTYAQLAAASLAAQLLEMARSRLLEAGEPSLALLASGLLSKTVLAFPSETK